MRLPQREGYGLLVPKGALTLPAKFKYQIILRQVHPQRDGNLTPGIFDAMGVFPDTGNGVNLRRTPRILIRSHENRERAGEISL